MNQFVGNAAECKCKDLINNKISELLPCQCVTGRFVCVSGNIYGKNPMP